MKYLFSTKYNAGAFNVALLILRLLAAGLMLNHGYEKLSHFDDTAAHITTIFGLSKKVCAILVIFAEFFCALFLIIGLFTRFACIPLIVTMGVAVFKVHHSQVFGDGQTATLFLAMYTAILLLGPGKISVDSMIGK